MLRAFSASARRPSWYIARLRPGWSEGSNPMVGAVKLASTMGHPKWRHLYQGIDCFSLMRPLGSRHTFSTRTTEALQVECTEHVGRTRRPVYSSHHSSTISPRFR